MEENYNYNGVYEVESATNFYKLDENGERCEPLPVLTHKVGSTTYRVKVGYDAENFTDKEAALKYYRKQLKKLTNHN